MSNKTVVCPTFSFFLGDPGSLSTFNPPPFKANPRRVTVGYASAAWESASDNRLPKRRLCQRVELASCPSKTPFFLMFLVCVCVCDVFFGVFFFLEVRCWCCFVFFLGCFFCLFFGRGCYVFCFVSAIFEGKNGSTPMSTINVSVEDLANHLHHRSVHSDYNDLRFWKGPDHSAKPLIQYHRLL